MAALVKYTDALLVQSTETWDGSGTNYRDNRSQWFNLDAASLSLSSGKFTIPPSTNVSSSDWVIDSGPGTVALALQERRAFCLKGAVTIQFTGTTLVLRLNTDFGWGTSHKVYIDGVQPSTIGGILTYANTVSCDSKSYQLAGPDYVDVVVADGLTDGPHTCVVYANGANQAYFAIAGYKVYGFQSRDLAQSRVWIVPSSRKLAQNQQALSLVNKSGKAIVNASLTYPASLVDANNVALAATSVAALTDANTAHQVIMPAFTGGEASEQKSFPLALSALYEDPNGTISQAVNVSLAVGSAALTVTGAWSTDTDTPGGVERIFSNDPGSATSQLSFTFTGASLTLTVEQDFGFGIFNVLDGNGTLMGTVSCAADQPTIFTATIAGWPATGTNTCVLQQSTTNKKYVVFISASWTSSAMYTQINETLNVVANAQQPYAMPVAGVVPDGYSLTYDAPIQGAMDSSGEVVRENLDIAYTEVLERFPTYAVCYQSGYFEILSQYDILIVDPFTARTADVLAWQAMGIKVFGYISLGEEDGFFVNRYDFDSANGPYVGDGKGPGGYASYYLKGGYQSRECTECEFDNQAVAGTKTCAQAQPMYFMGTGRCGGACSLDSLNGYVAFSSGGACGGGFTSANNWQRPDANTACTNSACPKYKPIHQLQTATKCPKYQQAADAYLQDFSIASPTVPDQNGVWAAYYTDSGSQPWLDRIMSYYVPTVLGGPVAADNEVVTVKAVTVSTGTAFAFDTAQFPIDESAAIVLTSMDGTISWSASSDYSFDMKTGAFTFNAGIDNPVTAGQQLKISYTKKGHHMDGIFMDTIDDADVYPKMGGLISALVNNLKSLTGTKLIANRGFTNLNSFIQSCEGVMFESWLTDWDENTGSYFKHADADSLAFSNGVNAQLMELRTRHVFDVYSLNYCNADASGDELRSYCTTEDRKKGYLSWTSTIDLNVPAPNIAVETPSQRITTNVFKRYRIKRY